MRNAKEMRVARKGRLLTAPPGSAIPESIEDDFAAPWVDLGHADDSGVELEPTKELGTLGVWSSAAPGLYFLESAGFTSTFNLVQGNRDVTKFYFGVDWTVDTPGVTAHMDLDANPPVDELMLAVVWLSQQGHKNYVIQERSAVNNRQNITLNRTNGVMYGVSVVSMPEADGDVERLARLLTNDPAIVGEPES